MSVSPAYIAFKLAYQISPIILTNGIATDMGNALPIVALTEGLNLAFQIASGGLTSNLDNLFANYEPLPGSALINNQIAMYPFANQAVAANAVIAQPLSISMLMRCPAQSGAELSTFGPSLPGVKNVVPVPFLGGYSSKLATMSALQRTLYQHNGMGGTYTIITPAYIYTNCIMTGMRDVSGGDIKQKQYQYQMEFIQPLVSIASAQTALNGLMNKFETGATISGTPTWTITGLAVGNPLSLLTSSLVPEPSLQ